MLTSVTHDGKTVAKRPVDVHTWKLYPAGKSAPYRGNEVEGFTVFGTHRLTSAPNGPFISVNILSAPNATLTKLTVSV